jgi:PAS domain S-box-containing protein
MVDRRAGANIPAGGTVPIVSLKLRELLDAAPDVVFACDHEGVLLWLNRTFESLTGRPAADFIGRPALDLVPPAARPRVLRVFLRQRRCRTPLAEIALPVLGRQESELPVNVRVRLLEHADGSVIFVGTAHPADAGAGTRRGPDAAGCPPISKDLIATMSHQSRTHMNGIMGMARLLLETNLDQDQKDMVGVICGAGQSLLELVNDAIEYSKLETGTLDLERIAFDLRVAVQETAALLEPRAREKGLEFTCQVHHEVPSRLWGDPGRLRQMLLHLGENAIRFTDQGRVSIAVERLREDERSVTARFSVRDTGVGASADQVSRLIQRCTPVTAPASGPSLGPSFCLLVLQRLVELMGGTIGVESEPGRGSRVWFDLTLEMQAQQEVAPGAQPSKSELAGQRALVVDPSPVMRRAFMGKLEALGCRVAEAEQPDEALAVLRQAVQSGEPFRYALIERELSSGDGEELGAAIRAEDALDGTFTLLFTSVGRRGDAARARARGFSAYLPKTIDGDELAEALCEVLRQATVVPRGAAPPLVTRYSLVEARRSRTRVLVVEDSTVSQLVTQWALNRLGYRVEVVGVAAAARAAWQRSPFDVALVDAQLPDADSLLLVRELRARDRVGHRTVFVAMVDDDGPASRARWQEVGADEFITKPVDLELMTALVERVTRTGAAWGPEVEDETAKREAAGVGSHAGGAHGEGEGRLEVVMPDVDRLLSESEVQEAMAAALRTAMTTEITQPLVVLTGTEAAPVAPESPEAPETTPAAETIEADDLAADLATPAAEVPRADELEAAPGAAAPVAEEPPAWGVDWLTAADVETLDDAKAACASRPAEEYLGETATLPAAEVLEGPAIDLVSAPAPASLDSRVQVTSEELTVESSLECAVGRGPDAASPPVEVTQEELAVEFPPECEVELEPEARGTPLEATGGEPDVGSLPTWEAEPAPEATDVLLETVKEMPRVESSLERVADPPLETAAPEPEPEVVRAPELGSNSLSDTCTPTPKAGGERVPIIDLRQLEEASMGIPSLREAMLSAFLGEIRPRLDRLTRAIGAGDEERVRSEAHGLRVLSGTIGAKACAEAFGELEQRGERRALEGAVVVLRSAYVEVIRAEEQVSTLREDRMAA